MSDQSFFLFRYFPSVSKGQEEFMMLVIPLMVSWSLLAAIVLDGPRAHSHGYKSQVTDCSMQFFIMVIAKTCLVFRGSARVVGTIVPCSACM